MNLFTSYSRLLQIYLNMLTLVLSLSWDLCIRTEAVPVNARCPANNYLNRINECVSCSKCSDRQHILSECSEYSDTVCEPCPSGTYKSKTENTCPHCTSCRRGQYIRKECSNTTDTVCVACPSGTFSMAENSDRCRPCKHCKFSEILMTKCNISNDSQCGDCKKDYYRNTATGDCERCSYCDPGVDFVKVTECEVKLGSSSNYICIPFGRPLPATVTQSLISTTSTTTHSELGTTEYQLANVLKMIIAVIVSIFVTSVVIVVVVLINKRTNSKKLLSRILGKSSTKESSEQANNCIDIQDETNNNLNTDELKLRRCDFPFKDMLHPIQKAEHNYNCPYTNCNQTGSIGSDNCTKCQSYPFIRSESPLEYNGCETDSCESGQNNEELDKENRVSSEVSLTDSGIEVEETKGMISAYNVTDNRKLGNNNHRPKTNSGKFTEYEAALKRSSKYFVLRISAKLKDTYSFIVNVF